MTIRRPGRSWSVLLLFFSLQGFMVPAQDIEGDAPQARGPFRSAVLFSAMLARPKINADGNDALSAPELARIRNQERRQALTPLDLDNDGAITTPEVRKWLTTVFQGQSERRTRKLEARWNPDQDEKVTAEEIRKASKSPRGEGMAWQFDADKNGTVEGKEFAEMMQFLPGVMLQTQIAKLRRMAEGEKEGKARLALLLLDESGDGKVSQEEVTHLVQAVARPEMAAVVLDETRLKKRLRALATSGPARPAGGGAGREIPAAQVPPSVSAPLTSRPLPPQPTAPVPVTPAPNAIPVLPPPAAGATPAAPALNAAPTPVAPNVNPAPQAGPAPAHAPLPSGNPQGSVSGGPPAGDTRAGGPVRAPDRPAIVTADPSPHPDAPPEDVLKEFLDEETKEDILW